MRRFYLLFAMTALLLSSCSGRDEWNNGGGDTPGVNVGKDQGTVTLSLKSSGVFGELKSFAKGSDDESVDVSNFFVNIYNQEGSLVKQWSEFKDMEAVVALDAGTYTVKAGSQDRSLAAFNQPIYDGSQQLVVRPSQLEDMALVCTLSNVKVSLALDATFLDELTNVKITLSNGETSLSYVDNYDVPAYFMPGTLTLQVEAERVVDGSAVTFLSTIEESQAQDHHIITLKAVSTGVGNPSIEVDNTTIDKNHNITVPGENEEVVDPEVDPEIDPDKPAPTVPAPTVTGNGVGSYIGDDPTATPTAQLTLTDAAAGNAPQVDMVVTTDASTTIAKLKVRIDSPYLTESELAGVGIPVEFDLANLEAGSDLEEGLKGLGLVGDEDIKTLNTYTVSIGGFMALLPSSLEDGTSPVSHKFHVTVEDALGEETQATLTIVRTVE